FAQYTGSYTGMITMRGLEFEHCPGVPKALPSTQLRTVSQYALGSCATRPAVPWTVGPSMFPGSAVIRNPSGTMSGLQLSMLLRYQFAPVPPGSAHGL